MIHSRHRDRRPRREGTAAVEFAVCLPFITFLLLATIDACSMIYLNHSLSITAYEGARSAVADGATNAAVTSHMQRLLDSWNVEDACIDISVEDLAATPEGSPISISISAPQGQDSMLSSLFAGNNEMTVSCTMVKE